MCGLCGVLFYPSKRSDSERQSILDISTANFVSNEERGRQASGIAVIQADGRHAIFKAPVPASAFVTLKAYRDVLETVNENTTCILCHTRKPTKGSPNNNLNNHPIKAGHVIGVHNGILKNDDELFAQHHLTRAGEVDSEVIFRLLDRVPPHEENGAFLESVRRKVVEIRGTFATLSVDLRKPTELLVMKSLRPLCLHFEEKLGVLFFSSRYLFLRRSFGRAVVTEALKNSSGYIFDALRLPESGCYPLASFEIPETVEF